MSTYVKLDRGVLGVGDRSPFVVYSAHGDIVLRAGDCVCDENHLNRIWMLGAKIESSDFAKLRQWGRSRLLGMIEGGQSIRAIAVSPDLSVADFVKDKHSVREPSSGDQLNRICSDLNALAERAKVLSEIDSDVRVLEEIGYVSDRIESIVEQDVRPATFLVFAEMQAERQSLRPWSLLASLIVLRSLCVDLEYSQSRWRVLAAAMLLVGLHQKSKASAINLLLNRSQSLGSSLFQKKLNSDVLRNFLSCTTLDVRQRFEEDTHERSLLAAEILLGQDADLSRECLFDEVLLLVLCDLYVEAVKISANSNVPATKRFARVFCLDDDEIVRAHGNSLLRIFGMFPPGLMVQLRGGEKAIVVDSGSRIDEPKVKLVSNRNGEPVQKNIIITTRQKESAPVGFVSSRAMYFASLKKIAQEAFFVKNDS